MTGNIYRNFIYNLSKINRHSLLYSGVQCTNSLKLCRFSNDSDDKREPKGGIYKVFQDEESPVILDVEEERASIISDKKMPEPWDEFYGLNLNRGVKGVFEIQDLVDVLKKHRGQNVFVVKVPEKVNYVDYLVVVSCSSQRHILALTQYVLKVYKKKRHENDPIPPVQGETTSDWIALDLGNIALHMMLDSVREKYDLETLWSVGSKFDDLTLQSDANSVLDILQKHSASLDSFKPADQLR